MPVMIGFWDNAFTETVGTNEITTTLASPGAGARRAVRNVHMRVNAADGGSGLVTFQIFLGATLVKQWIATFVAGVGCYCDYVAEVITLKILRTGLTSAHMDWATVIYEG